MRDKVGYVFPLRHDFGVGGGGIQTDDNRPRLQFRNNVVSDPPNEAIGYGQDDSIRSVKRFLKRCCLDATGRHLLSAFFAGFDIVDPVAR